MTERGEGSWWVTHYSIRIHIVYHFAQVVEPCFIMALYHLKDCEVADLEETVDMTMSRIVILLSMEAIHSLVKPLSRAISGAGVSCHCWW